ncbi:uncharacterized protein BcabD6B2_38540 [Babesia caballi]|uniref:Uncharacterized protein n=1 Tax=Babesia caballi TaxID=5871 RepID=A0AAV4LWG9_BABCB|nr:hypothetical protein BcabD6B2_38540 [Babesia caballi]
MPRNSSERSSGIIRAPTWACRSWPFSFPPQIGQEIPVARALQRVAHAGEHHAVDAEPLAVDGYGVVGAHDVVQAAATQLANQVARAGLIEADHREQKHRGQILAVDVAKEPQNVEHFLLHLVRRLLNVAKKGRILNEGDHGAERDELQKVRLRVVRHPRERPQGNVAEVAELAQLGGDGVLGRPRRFDVVVELSLEEHVADGAPEHALLAGAGLQVALDEADHLAADRLLQREVVQQVQRAIQRRAAQLARSQQTLARLAMENRHVLLGVVGALVEVVEAAHPQPRGVALVLAARSVLHQVEHRLLQGRQEALVEREARARQEAGGLLNQVQRRLEVRRARAVEAQQHGSARQDGAHRVQLRVREGVGAPEQVLEAGQRYVQQQLLAVLVEARLHALDVAALAEEPHRAAHVGVQIVVGPEAADEVGHEGLLGGNGGGQLGELHEALVEGVGLVAGLLVDDQGLIHADHRGVRHERVAVFRRQVVGANVEGKGEVVDGQRRQVNGGDEHAEGGSLPGRHGVDEAQKWLLGPVLDDDAAVVVVLHVAQEHGLDDLTALEKGVARARLVEREQNPELLLLQLPAHQAQVPEQQQTGGLVGGGEAAVHEVHRKRGGHADVDQDVAQVGGEVDVIHALEEPEDRALGALRQQQLLVELQARLAHPQGHARVAAVHVLVGGVVHLDLDLELSAEDGLVLGQRLQLDQKAVDDVVAGYHREHAHFAEPDEAQGEDPLQRVQQVAHTEGVGLQDQLLEKLLEAQEANATFADAYGPAVLRVESRRDALHAVRAEAQELGREALGAPVGEEVRYLGEKQGVVRVEDVLVGGR